MFSTYSVEYRSVSEEIMFLSKSLIKRPRPEDDEIEDVDEAEEDNEGEGEYGLYSILSKKDDKSPKSSMFSFQLIN